MKKFLAIMIVVLVCLSHVACGGPDLEAVSAAHTKASTAFNEVATYMNENPDVFGEEEVTFMTELAATLEDMKATMESGDVTQEQVDEAEAWYADVYDRMMAIKDAYAIE